MVQNNLNEEQAVEQAEKLSFPSSVVEFFQGYLGSFIVNLNMLTMKLFRTSSWRFSRTLCFSSS
jgi:pyruvate carboxylase